MEIRNVYAVFFSPTGNTEKVACLLAGELADRLQAPLTARNITPCAAREEEFSFTEGDLVVVAAPTYAGKLPNKILPWFSSGLHGGGALAVPVVTFGNRSYDHALAELTQVLAGAAFHPVAAGAFVGRHAFTDRLASGRPGAADLAEVQVFAGQIADKVKALTGPVETVSVPGNAAAPYYVPKGTDGQPAKFLKAKPQTDLTRCGGCGACVRWCPMGAIDPENPANVPGTCIKCQACVRRCARQAKYFDDPAFLSHVRMLEQNFTEPKENETFL